MENIDDLMRQKFDNDDPGGRFEFREEYWEQALALIKEDEARKKKKRRRFFWFMLSGMALLCLGFGWWCWPATGNSDARFSHSNSELNTIERVSDGGLSNGQITDNREKGESNNVENNTVQEEKLTASGDNNSVSSNYNSLKNGSVGHTSLPTQASSPKRDGTYVDEPTNPVQSEMTAKNGEDKGDSQSLSAINELTDLVGTNNEQPDQPIIPVEDNASSPSKAFSNQLLAMLPVLPDSVISMQDMTNAEPKQINSTLVTPIEPVKDRRFSFGIAGAAAAYTNSPDKRWFGYSGHLFGSWQFRKNWALTFGLGMRYQPGNWADSTGNAVKQSLKYSFGFESTVSERRSLGIISMELPVSADWHRGSVTLSCGLAPGKLLVALDRFIQQQESSFSDLTTIRNRIERGDKSYFNQYYLNAFAGAEWRFYPNVSLFTRGNYRIGKLLKSTSEKSAIQKGSSVELGLRLKLF